MMNNLQKVGGVSALIMALSYLVGIAVFVTLLNPDGPLNPVEQIAYLLEKQSIIFPTMLFIYVIAGFSLLILVQALFERLKTPASAMVQTAAVIGFIWSAIVISAGMIYLLGMDSVIELNETDPAQAATVWLAVMVVFEGLGGGTEIVGGVWIVLISWVAMRTKALPKLLNYLGFIVGVAGMVTIIPLFADATMIFGLGQIPWFIWVGFILLRATKANNP